MLTKPQSLIVFCCHCMVIEQGEHVEHTSLCEHVQPAIERLNDNLTTHYLSSLTSSNSASTTSSLPDESASEASPSGAPLCACALA
ncbi:MAG: hypothetical protein ACI9VT_000450 [Psychroserpens sp.]|jgi:hypothetical protein